jgi:hypothetical protein
MPDTYALLRQAILERKHVIAEYDGFHREMCPHVLGWKDGVRHIFSFQFAGGSSKGLPPEGQWKWMSVAYRKYLCAMGLGILAPERQISRKAALT